MPPSRQQHLVLSSCFPVSLAAACLISLCARHSSTQRQFLCVSSHTRHAVLCGLFVEECRDGAWVCALYPCVSLDGSVVVIMPGETAKAASLLLLTLSQKRTTSSLAIL